MSKRDFIFKYSNKIGKCMKKNDFHTVIKMVDNLQKGEIDIIFKSVLFLLYRHHKRNEKYRKYILQLNDEIKNEYFKRFHTDPPDNIGLLV